MSARVTPDAPSRRPAPAPPPEAGVRVEVCALTDVGRTRDHNEDAFLVADLAAAEPLAFAEGGGARAEDGAVARTLTAPAEGVLFLVADGLGGAAAGEIASRMGARAVFDALRARATDAAADAERYALALRDAVQAANAAIHERAGRQAELRGMGTTVTAAALRGDTLYLAQVGDSRAYLVRDGVAQQLTKDQSLMQKLVEAGEITPEQAETSVRRNIILQALGPEATVKVDLTHQPLRRGDLLLLCSDGLSGQVRAPELADAAAARGPDLAALCRDLIARANATGGPDNITVVAARFDGDGLADATDTDPVGHQRFPLGTPTPTTPVHPIAPVAPAPSDALAPDLASGKPQVAGEAAVAAGVTPVELAERRDRARVVYAGLALLAVVLAALLAWRLLAPGATQGGATAAGGAPATAAP
jgi:protein phosphatase